VLWGRVCYWIGRIYPTRDGVSGGSRLICSRRRIRRKLLTRNLEILARGGFRHFAHADGTVPSGLGSLGNEEIPSLVWVQRYPGVPCMRRASSRGFEGGSRKECRAWD
jgi:hypothetical protein